MINASIITIGDELLIGQTIDTNSAFISREFNRIGIWVRRRVAVGDNREEIWRALDEEGLQSNIIIMTGGLGPTADDITKPLLCEYFGGKMITDPDVLAHVKYLFEKVYRRPGPILERNLRQAEVPDVCTVLHNARGSAPGMWFQKEVKNNGTSRSPVYISLPGVPHEMKGLMMDEVIPRLLKEFRMPAIIHRTAFTAGQGESMIAELLIDFEKQLPAHISLAYLPHFGMVKLRLSGTGEDREALEAEMEQHFKKLQSLVSKYLVTDEDEGLEIVIGKILRAKGLTMGTAESCTGGLIASQITSIPGSSDYFKGSIVSYANEVKENLLGVTHDTLSTRGAVSEETVKEMVAGAIKQLKVDFALATSGIMGPGGGSEAKPVGTVWIAVGNTERTETLQLHLRFDRERNTATTAAQALNFFRKFVLTNS